jgi:hypothetical protein
MPQIIARTNDAFEVTALCDWCASRGIESVDISALSPDGCVTVTLFGMERKDERFAAFADRVQDWDLVEPGSRELTTIVSESDGDLWRAYFEELPGVFYHLAEPLLPVLCLAHDFEICHEKLRCVSQSPARYLFIVGPGKCVRCRGTGRDVFKEACERCGGSGRV